MCRIEGLESPIDRLVVITVAFKAISRVSYLLECPTIALQKGHELLSENEGLKSALYVRRGWILCFFLLFLLRQFDESILVPMAFHKVHIFPRHPPFENQEE